MKTAITFESTTHSKLLYTARKKKNHYELLSVQSGFALIRLGKWEYLVKAGDYFWLPFDSLTSVTILPQSTISTIVFSIRTTENLPHQGGYISNTPLLDAVIDKLQNSQQLRETAQTRLLHVIQDELLEAHIHTILSGDSERINSYLSSLNANQPAPSTLSAEMMLCLRVREADKLKKSGIKEQKIADHFFDGNIDQLNQAWALIL